VTVEVGGGSGGGGGVDGGLNSPLLAFFKRSGGVRNLRGGGFNPPNHPSNTALVLVRLSLPSSVGR